MSFDDYQDFVEVIFFSGMTMPTAKGGGNRYYSSEATRESPNGGRPGDGFSNNAAVV
jgi:hypothetical protein